MKRNTNVYILDTSAIMAYIEEEDGVDTVQELFELADSKRIDIVVSFMTFMEIYYISIRKRNKDEAQLRIELMKSLPILRIESNEDTGILAGEIKSKYNLSVADAWIVALAKQTDAILVHKDPEFDQIESEVKMLKLPYKLRNQ